MNNAEMLKRIKTLYSCSNEEYIDRCTHTLAKRPFIPLNNSDTYGINWETIFIKNRISFVGENT